MYDDVETEVEENFEDFDMDGVMDMDWDSKEGNEGRTVGWYTRLGLIKNPRPPPLP